MGKIKDPLDSSTKCQPRIQVPQMTRILDHADPGYRVFLGSWRMSCGVSIGVGTGETTGVVAFSLFGQTCS